MLSPILYRFLLKKLVLFRKPKMFSFIIFSVTLERVEIREISLKLPHMKVDPFFCIGVTTAFFNLSGNLLEEKLKLINKMTVSRIST